MSASLRCGKIGPMADDVRKATFDFDSRVSKKLADLKYDLQHGKGYDFAPSEASSKAIICALILDATADRVAELLKKGRKRR